MKRVNKSILAVIVATAVAPAANASDKTLVAAQQAIHSFYTAPLDDVKELTAAQNKAIASLVRMGVDAKDAPGVLAQFESKELTRDYVDGWTGYNTKDNELNHRIKTNTLNIEAVASGTVNNAERISNTQNFVKQNASDIANLKAGKVDASVYTHDKVRQLSVDSEQDEAIQTNADDINSLKTAQSKTSRDEADEIGHIKDAVDAHGNAINQNITDIATIKGDVAQNTTTITNQAGELASVKGSVAQVQMQSSERYQGMLRAKQAAETQGAIDIATASQQHLIEQGAKVIADTAAKVDGVAAQVQIQNNERIQGMLQARQEATAKAALATLPTVTDRSKEIAANREGISSNRTDIKKLSDQQTIQSVQYSKQIETLAGNQQAQTDVINHNASVTRNTQSQVDRNTQSISKLNSNFSNLKSEVNENKKDASAGVSGAMAQANIPQVIQGQSFAVGAGVGGYDGESAVAVGFSARVTQNVTMKATVSDDTASNIGYGAGVSIGW